MLSAYLRTAFCIMAAAIAALALAGCDGGYGESAMDDGSILGFPAADGAAYPAEVVEVVKEVEVEVLRDAPAMAMSEQAASAPAAPPAPAAPAAPAPMQTAVPVAASAGGVDVPSQDEIRARYASVRRVIVRTAQVDIVVDAVQPSLDAIGRAAESADGWVVSSSRASKHAGSISVRVPATALDGFIETLRGMAAEVVSESTDSQDVTDEYFDLRARLDNMLATQERMLEFLDLAPDARQALEVQRDLNELQTDIERAKGRIQLLEETSAFSLVTVNLTLAAQDMRVDAGPDMTEAAGDALRFRAFFTPPPGISEFSTTWDFGDGSSPIAVYRTAPTANEGERVAETVVHVYEDPTDSPFIARVSVSGTGEGGVAEGEDTLIASVSRIPQIQVYAGDGWMDVEQNDEALFSGSFTRPEGLRNVRYEWDFGDGSPPVSGGLPDATTRAAASHVYQNYRDVPYTARLTITADSDAGMAAASAEVSVSVRRARGFLVAGYDLSETFKTAVRALSVAVQLIGTLLVWALVFSPIWGALGAVIWLIIRLDARSRAKRRAAMEAQIEAGRAAAERETPTERAP